MSKGIITENVDRRLGINRREFTYTTYLPERRSGKDRREELNITLSQANEYRSDVEYRINFSSMTF